MTGNERRKKIIAMLGEKPVSATLIAGMLEVSRQIIVSDVALLRASGEPIVSTPRGYIIETKESKKGLIKVITSRHLNDKIQEELYTIVDNGGKILDVIVEHGVYGPIQIALELSSRYECDQFLKKLRESSSPPLAELTGGIHYHTILCENEECFERIKKSLKKLGVLVENTVDKTV